MSNLFVTTLIQIKILKNQLKINYYDLFHENDGILQQIKDKSC